MRALAAILVLILLGGCALTPSLQTLRDSEKSPTVQASPIQQRLEDVPALDGEIITMLFIVLVIEQDSVNPVTMLLVLAVLLHKAQKPGL